MYRNAAIKALAVIGIVTIIITAAQYYRAFDEKTVSLPAGKAAELERHKERLEDTIAELRSELADKRKELAGLEMKQDELEGQYNKLLAERQRITERLEELKGAQ